jgi:hypothetical protein
VTNVTIKLWGDMILKGIFSAGDEKMIRIAF